MAPPQASLAAALAPAVALFAAAALAAPMAPEWWGGWAWSESSAGVRGLAATAGLALVGALLLHRGCRARLLLLVGRIQPTWRWLPGLWLLCWLMRERRHFGDWVSIGFTTALMPEWILEPIVFWRQPLAHGFLWLHWRTLYFLSPSWEIRDTIQMTMSLWGALFLVLWGVLCRELAGPGRRAGLLWLWCATSGLLALALGHVETYAISLSALFAACIACMRYLRGAGSLPVAALGCVIAVAVHPQNAILGAGVLAAVAPAWWGRNTPRHRIATLAAVMLAVAALWGVTMLPAVRAVLENMSHGGSDKAFLSPAAAFSAGRAFEIANVLLVAVPLALPLLAVSLWNRRALAARADAACFLAASAGAGLAYILFVYNKLEMSEDWDLVGPSLALLQTSVAVVVLRGFPCRAGATALLAGVALQLLLTGQQVVLRWYPDEERAATYQRYIDDSRASQRVIEERWGRVGWRELNRP